MIGHLDVRGNFKLLKPQADSLLFAAVLLLLQPIPIEEVDPVFQIGGLRTTIKITEVFTKLSSEQSKSVNWTTTSFSSSCGRVWCFQSAQNILVTSMVLRVKYRKPLSCDSYPSHILLALLVLVISILPYISNISYS